MIRKINQIALLLIVTCVSHHAIPTVTKPSSSGFWHKTIVPGLKKHRYKIFAAAAATMATIAFTRWKTQQNKARTGIEQDSQPRKPLADKTIKSSTTTTWTEAANSPTPTPPLREEILYNLFKPIVLQWGKERGWYNKTQLLTIKKYNQQQGSRNKHVYLVFGENDADYSKKEGDTRGGYGGQARMFIDIGHQPTAAVGIVTTKHMQSPLSLTSGTAKESIDKIETLLNAGHTLILPAYYDKKTQKYILNIGTGLADNGTQEQREFLKALSDYLAQWLAKHQAKGDVLILQKNEVYSEFLTSLQNQNALTYTVKGQDCSPIPHHFVIVPKAPIKSLNNLADNEEESTNLMMAIIDAANTQAKTTIKDRDLDYNLIIYTGASSGQVGNKLYCHWTAGRKMFFLPRTARAAHKEKKTHTGCPFCEINDSNIVMSNDNAIVIKDIKPRSNEHFLIIPRKHIKNLKDITNGDKETIKDMTSLLQKLAKQYGNKTDNGFTFVSNNGPDAHQTVEHMHWHFASGSDLGFITVEDWTRIGAYNYEALQKNLFSIT